MEASSAAPSCDIHPEMELEDVFLQFFPRFECLPNPRSVAEIRITPEEFDALKSWFSARWGWPRMWCDDTWQINLSNELFASRQEMFGSLLLILGSEVCRDNSGEDAVWPAITSVLKADRISFPILFVGGQPTAACKKALAAGAQRLKLRHVVDRFGAQEYFDTLKLQFGFTIKGAARRLGDWLDGLGVPIAVKILAGIETGFGDLKSISFTQLWDTFQQFRHNRISEGDAASILQTSPWIRSDWIPALLQASRLRLVRICTPVPAADASEHSSVPICEPLLRWDHGAKPRLMVRLDEEQIIEMLTEVNTATFAVDGRVVDRWVAEGEGRWRGKRELPCEPDIAKPNLRPKLLSISADGRPIEEIDLLELGFGESLLIFDIKTREIVDSASTMDRNKNYALICDPDLSISETSECLTFKDRSVHRLSAPWSEELLATCEGSLYWKPRVSNAERLQPIHLTLGSLPGELVEIGEAVTVCIQGVPIDASAVSLLAGRSAYSLRREEAVWITEKPVHISMGMCSGEERVRVRVTGDGYARTVMPKMLLNVRGIACIETEPGADAELRWYPLNRRQPLNRADGCGKARVFMETPSCQLYEGPHLVAPISSRALALRDLHGWGAPLIVRHSNDSDFVLVQSVEDSGVGRFLPSLFGRATGCWISWRTPIQPSDQHQVLVWSDMLHGQRTLPAAVISSQNDGATWKLPSIASVAAMAVAYQGARIASYWDPQAILHDLRNRPSATVFGLVRWLKIPILNDLFNGPVRDAVRLVPAEFVKGWLGDSLPLGLVHRPADQSLEIVVRAFFWDYSEAGEGKIDKIVRAFPETQFQTGSQRDSEAFKSTLVRLGETCPSLAYSFARHKVRGDKYRKYVRTVASALLREPESRSSEQIRSHLAVACRDCARLIGTTPESLEESVRRYGRQLDGSIDARERSYEQDLRRLGETSRGRQFISASLLLRQVERIGL